MYVYPELSAANYVLAAVPALLALTILSIFHLKKRPEWYFDDDAPEKERTIVRNNWVKVNVIGVIAGIILAGIVLYGASLLPSENPPFAVQGQKAVTVTYRAMYSLPTVVAVLAFVGSVSALTDVCYRLVDRHILRIATVIIIAAVLPFLINEGDTLQWVLTGVLVGCILLMQFMPAWGLSDVRAAAVAFLGISPFYTTVGTMVSIVSIAVLAIFYALATGGVRALMPNRKTSVPLVPVTLIPSALLATGLVFTLGGINL